MATAAALHLNTWYTAAVIASPHLLYAFVWFYPRVWRSWFKAKSVEVFETCAWLLKVLQFGASVYWYALRAPGGVDLRAPPAAAWAAFLALGAAGQALNVAIYRAIGHAGVYYGFKLGHSVPWVDGFPFSVVAHPQYVGSVLSIWAVVALLWTQAPPGMAAMAAYWTALYVITGWKEDRLHVA